VTSAARAFSPARAVAQAGGDGQHVLHRAADFGADQVVVGIDPHRRPVEGRHQRIAHRRMRAGRDQRGRLAAGDFLREAGAGEHARQQVRRDFGLHLVAEQAALGAGFESLAQPRHRGRAAAQRLQLLAQARHRRGDDDQVAPAASADRVAIGDAQRGSAAGCRAGSGVLAALAQHGGLGRIARPERDLVPGGGVGRQGRAPRAGAEHEELHRVRPT
jgi:hypothetical protein